MAYSGGYSGQIAVVDLSTQMVEVTSLEPDLARKFLGGRGLGVALLTRYMVAHADPLSPENVIIFEAAPFTGLWISAGRLHVTARSPLTGTIGDGNSGGAWAPELRAAGFDAVVVRGRADAPVYIFIKDGDAFLLIKIKGSEIGMPKFEV